MTPENKELVQDLGKIILFYVGMPAMVFLLMWLCSFCDQCDMEEYQQTHGTFEMEEYQQTHEIIEVEE